MGSPNPGAIAKSAKNPLLIKSGDCSYSLDKFAEFLTYPLSILKRVVILLEDSSG